MFPTVHLFSQTSVIQEFELSSKRPGFSMNTSAGDGKVFCSTANSFRAVQNRAAALFLFKKVMSFGSSGFNKFKRVKVFQ